MRSIMLTIFIAIFISGCGFFSKDTSYDYESKDRAMVKEIARLNLDCSDCSKFFGKKVMINGREYISDVAINCCLTKNLIDTEVGLKKVYIHRVVDKRDSAKGIYYTDAWGKKSVFDIKLNVEALFYMFLEQELKTRGMVVVDTQTSPYTYRLDFDFNSIAVEYFEKSKTLDGRIAGVLKLSNINFKKDFEISTKQKVRKLVADEKSSEFDLFIALLAKQTANKVAQAISKI